MGLYAEIDIVSDWGFPASLTGGDESIGFETVYVDYSGACAIFVDTFLRVAHELVPVDTGYLKSTIDAGTDGMSYCYAEATADYAQYVEYGTWCMDAQPYFEIALAEACHESGLAAQEAHDAAQELLEGLLESLMEAAMAAAGAGPGGMGGSFGSFLGGLALTMVLFAVLFPVLVNLYAIADTLFNGGQGPSGGGGDGFIPEVIIT